MITKIMKTNTGKTFNVSMSIDCQGRFVCRSLEPVVKVENGDKPFYDCNFIVIDKKDAENILDMLNIAILKLESGTRSDNDVEVFGEKAISYERLIDYLGHTFYDKLSEEDKKAIEDYKAKLISGELK